MLYRYSTRFDGTCCFSAMPKVTSEKPVSGSASASTMNGNRCRDAYLVGFRTSEVGLWRRDSLEFRRQTGTPKIESNKINISYIYICIYKYTLYIFQEGDPKQIGHLLNLTATGRCMIDVKCIEPVSSDHMKPVVYLPMKNSWFWELTSPFLKKMWC